MVIIYEIDFVENTVKTAPAKLKRLEFYVFNLKLI